MTDSATNTFLVNPDADPVLIAIQGRASFQNSASISQFLSDQLAAGKKNYAMDFAACTTIDSTFLGVLAGHALNLRKLASPGKLLLFRLGERNAELIRNLGLHRLITLCETAACAPDKLPPPTTALPDTKLNQTDNALLVLAAHENLVAADANNHAKFKDVLAYLKHDLSQQ